MAEDNNQRQGASARTRARIAARKAARKAEREAKRAAAAPSEADGDETTAEASSSRKGGASQRAAGQGLVKKKSAAKKSAAKKSAAKKSTAKKSTAKKSTAKKSTAKKSSPRAKSNGAAASKRDAKRPTVMVTGAAGALARQVIRQLRDQVNIVAVDFRRRVRIDGDTPSYQGDPNHRQFEDIFRQHNIEGVIHLGRVDSDELTPERRYNANVLGTQRLFRLCSQYDVKQIVVMSTYFVYGASPYNPALLAEDAPLKASGLTMDLIDSVELENLAAVALWKHPELHMTVLRPCNIAGPRVRNTMSQLMERPVAPHLVGFSPMMQFIHVDDMARAIVVAYTQNKPGIYNVAPDQWMSYQDVLRACGCASLPVPSVPPVVPSLISRLLRWRAFPRYLVNYLKYPVLIDGGHFERTFNFHCERSLDEVLRYYRQRKSMPD